LKAPIKYFNSREAAKILGVNVSTIKRWTEEGKLQCIRSAGGHRKFLMEHLNAFLNQNKKRTSRVNLFPIESPEDLDLSHRILKGDFEFLTAYVLQNALNSRRERIQKVLNGLYLAQHPLPSIYDHIITPVLHRIGEMWESQTISIIDEHLASQNIRDSVVRLQGIIRIPEHKVGKALCLNPSHELHDLALKMVDHLLELRGFQVFYSGQITPTTDVAQILDDHLPDRLYISCTFVPDSVNVQEEMDVLFQLCLEKGVRVFVGGAGFDRINHRHPAVVKRLCSFSEVAEI
jgi:excisionase family DNA binding protein